MAVRELWEKTKFPGSVKYAEDLDAALENVIQCRRLMYRYGEFRENNNESRLREMRGLKNTIPRG